MIITPRNNLTIAAAELASSSPKAWAKFLDAMQEFADGAKDDCVRSPLEALPVNQGRAQEAVAIYDLLSRAVKEADILRRG